MSHAVRCPVLNWVEHVACVPRSPKVVDAASRPMGRPLCRTRLTRPGCLRERMYCVFGRRVPCICDTGATGLTFFEQREAGKEVEADAMP